LVIDFPEIEEMDINPLIVLAEGSGARVVDARILISDEHSTAESAERMLPKKSRQ
jgi:hypothetical protein